MIRFKNKKECLGTTVVEGFSIERTKHEHDKIPSYSYT